MFDSTHLVDSGRSCVAEDALVDLSGGIAPYTVSTQRDTATRKNLTSLFDRLSLDCSSDYASAPSGAMSSVRSCPYSY
jgi:hypothetical protein